MSIRPTRSAVLGFSVAALIAVAIAFGFAAAGSAAALPHDSPAADRPAVVAALGSGAGLEIFTDDAAEASEVHLVLSGDGRSR